MITLSYFWFSIILLTVAIIVSMIVHIITLGEDTEDSPIFGFIIWVLVPFVYIDSIFKRCYKYIKRIYKK